MELGDIFLKMANNARLTPREMDFLRTAGNETQQRNSFVAGLTKGTSSLSVSQITAGSLTIGNEVYSGLSARYYQDGQDIPDGAGFTKLNPITKYYADYGFSLSGGDITIPQTGIYVAFLTTKWNSNATGIRKQCFSTAANCADTVQGLAANTILFAANEFSAVAGDTGAIYVSQTSGGSLHLSSAYFTIRKVR